jgi:hypothetical protein
MDYKDVKLIELKWVKGRILDLPVKKFNLVGL